VTDANGKVKRTYRDVRELITSVKESNQGATIWTSYAYDALKQITQVVDNLSNTTIVSYDNFGRRTVINNPDTGRTETQYDLASNVTKKITANLQRSRSRSTIATTSTGSRRSPTRTSRGTTSPTPTARREP